MGLRLFLFSTSRLGHRTFATLPILCIAWFKGRKNIQFFIQVFIHSSVYQTENIYASKLSCLTIWCPSRKFGHYNNKCDRLLVLFSTIRLKGEVNFFISRGFFKKFSQCLYRDIADSTFKGIFLWRSFSLSKYFQSLGIKYIVNLYISLHGWQ